MAIKSLDINIDNLKVNPENYRFEPVDNENIAIKTMLDKNNKNIKELLKDILKYGLNPSERLMVYKINDYYVVLEGNRRITALKIIKDVNILKNIDEDYFKQYSKILNTNKNMYDISQVPCVIFDNIEEADKWVELKHTGSNGGKGTIPWDTSEKRRFKDRTTLNKTNDKSNIITSLFKYIESSPLYEDSIKQKLKNIPITTFERLLQDPLVRETIGIDIDKNIIFKLYPDEELKKPLTKILNDLISKNIVVTDIYKKDDRIDYMSNFNSLDLPDDAKQLEQAERLINNFNNNNKSNNDNKSNDDKTNDNKNNDDKNNDNKSDDDKNNNNKSDDDKNNNNKSDDDKNNDNKSDDDKNNDNKSDDDKNNNNKSNDNKKIRDNLDINKRKYLIPGKVQIKISSGRINQIYKELKKLDINEYPNSVAVLFRVFIELIVDNYINKNDIKSVTEDSNLKKKVQECLEDLKNKKLIDKNAMKPVNIAISNPNFIMSINTFNSYVHNGCVFPDPTQLKNSWNNLSTFLITLLENSN